MSANELTPIMDFDHFDGASYVVHGADVSGWESLVWRWDALGTTGPATPLYLVELWHHGDPGDSVIANTHAISLETIFTASQLYATRVLAPFLSITSFEFAGPYPFPFRFRLWGSQRRLDTYDVWRAPLLNVANLSVPAGATVTLTIPSYVGPVAINAYVSGATGTGTQISIWNDVGKLAIPWKQGDSHTDQPFTLPPGLNTVQLFNQDGAARLFSVSIVPAPR